MCDIRVYYPSIHGRKVGTYRPRVISLHCKKNKMLLIKVLVEYSDILDQGSITREIAVYSKYLRRITIYLVQNFILDSKLLTRDEILTYF